MRRLVAVALLCVAGPAAAATYDLPALTRRLERIAPLIAAAEAQADNARGQLGWVQTQWAPSGNFQTTVGGGPRMRCADVNGFVNPSQLEREVNCIRTDVVDLTRYTGSLADASPFAGVALRVDLSIIQPLFTFGKIESGLPAARHNLAMNLAAADGARADARYRAAEAYWKVKWARAALDVADTEVVQLAEWVALLDETLAGENRPNYSEGDLARLKLALDLARIRRLDLERHLVQAEAQVRLLADDPEAAIDGADLTLEPMSEHEAFYYEDAWHRHRPEARQIASGLEASRMWRRLKLTELLPDLGLVTGAAYLYASGATDLAAIPGAGLRLTVGAPGAWFVFALRENLDFAVRHARFLQAAAEHQQNLARRAYYLGGIALEVKKAWLDVTEARRRVERAAHAEKIARGWYAAVDQNLKTGLYTDGREMTEVVRTYATYRMWHLRALHDANVMQAALRRATGLAELVDNPTR
jgi:outer membrane protein TolC